MATVYLARQTSMNRVVALKVLPKNLSDEAYFKRFEREVTIVAQLEHRSIVPVYDHGTLDGQPFIAMRYMAGGSLDQRLVTGPMLGALTVHWNVLDHAPGLARFGLNPFSVPALISLAPWPRVSRW